MVSIRKEGKVLFNTLKTFYLRLYGVRHMVEDHIMVSIRKEGRKSFI